MNVKVDFKTLRKAGLYGGVVLLSVVGADGKPVAGESVACVLVADEAGDVVPVPVSKVEGA